MLYKVAKCASLYISFIDVSNVNYFLIMSIIIDYEKKELVRMVDFDVKSRVIGKFPFTIYLVGIYMIFT